MQDYIICNKSNKIKWYFVMKILSFKDIMLPRGCFRPQPSTLFILSSQIAWIGVSRLLSLHRTRGCLRKQFWVLTGEGCCTSPSLHFTIFFSHKTSDVGWERDSGKLAKSWPHRWDSFLRGSAVCQWEKRQCLESGSHGQFWLRGRWGGEQWVLVGRQDFHQCKG